MWVNSLHKKGSKWSVVNLDLRFKKGDIVSAFLHLNNDLGPG